MEKKLILFFTYPKSSQSIAKIKLHYIEKEEKILSEANLNCPLLIVTQISL